MRPAQDLMTRRYAASHKSGPLNHARHLRGDFREPAARSGRSPRGATCGPKLGRGSTRRRRSVRGRRAFRCCSTAGRCARRRGSLSPRRRSELARGARRGMGRAAGQGRSGRDAAHAARQLDHRRRCAGARAGRGRDREVSRHRPVVLSRRRTRPGWSPASARIGTRCVEWARDTLGARFVLAEGVMHAPQPAGGDRRGGGGDPERRRHQGVLAARRAQRRHHADRLGAAGAGAGRGPPHHRRGVGRGACRRGLEHAVLGPRRAGAAAPRLSLRRDAGGGDACSTRCASSCARRSPANCGSSSAARA